MVLTSESSAEHRSGMAVTFSGALWVSETDDTPQGECEDPTAALPKDGKTMLEELKEGGLCGREKMLPKAIESQQQGGLPLV